LKRPSAVPWLPNARRKRPEGSSTYNGREIDVICWDCLMYWNMKRNIVSEGWRIWRCCRIGGEESRFGRCANAAVSRTGLLWAVKFLSVTCKRNALWSGEWVRSVQGRPPWDYLVTQRFGQIRAKVLFGIELHGSIFTSFSRDTKLSSQL
jgi:hypothetical protein